MTRHVLRATTAVALCLSLAAPAPILAANVAEGAFQVAQAEGKGKSDEARGKGAKAAEEAAEEAAQEACADGSEPPCEAAADAQEDEAKRGKSAEAPGQAKKAEDEAEAAPKPEETAAPAAEESKPEQAEAAAEEPKPEQAGATPPAEGGASEETLKPAEAAPAADETPAAEAAGDEAKPGKRKKKGQADDADATADAPRAEEEKPAAAGAEPAKKPETDAPSDAAEAKPEAKPETKQEEAETTAETPSTAPAAEQTATSDAPAEEVKPAPAAAAEEGAAPVEVTSETVTEETSRSSDEEVTEAKPAEASKKKDKDDDLIKILGAAAGGAVVGAILNEALGGGRVVESTGDRVIIERDGEYIVRKDENEILRRPGSEVRTERFRDGSSRTVVERADGVRVVTIRDAEGYVVRRSRIMPNGEEVVLFDDTWAAEQPRRVRIRDDELPRYDRSVPHRSYVDYSRADRRDLRDVLLTGPVARLDRGYTLRQVRENERLRDVMPRLDLDVITFDFGSSAISPDQARRLDALGWAIRDILAENPDELFLIEGHTDAVGSRVANLLLSDRRAETVALALTEYYDIPPENLVTQGYGEEFLKIDTQAAERANRRAAVRRITPLLESAQRSR